MVRAQGIEPSRANAQRIFDEGLRDAHHNRVLTFQKILTLLRTRQFSAHELQRTAVELPAIELIQRFGKQYAV
jgi:hypothetical protein